MNKPKKEREILLEKIINWVSGETPLIGDSIIIKAREETFRDLSSNDYFYIARHIDTIVKQIKKSMRGKNK